MKPLAARWQRLHREFSDFAVYFLLPLPGLMLPWRLAWPAYRCLARHPWIFRRQSEATLRNAAKLLEIPDASAWCRRYRLVLIIDLVDFWISFLQPWRWSKLLQQKGNWPAQRPLVVVGTHWGPGFLALRSLRRAGIAPHYIIRATPSTVLREQRIRQFYIFLRRFHLGRLFPGKRYNPGGFPRRLARALRAGECILALADVPADRRGEQRRVTVFGREAALQPGIVGLAMREKAALVTYTLGLDFATGRRILEINPVRENMDEEQAWRYLGEFMARPLERDPAQWGLWHAADSFFITAP